jgi:hypothetical protein
LTMRRERANPAMTWDDHPNLRLRPHAPSRGRGRLQVQVRRAFLVHGPVVSSSALYDWCYPRRRRLTQRRRHSVWRILVTIADPIGRVPPHGAWLWRLRTDRLGIAFSSLVGCGNPDNSEFVVPSGPDTNHRKFLSCSILHHCAVTALSRQARPAPCEAVRAEVVV